MTKKDYIVIAKAMSNMKQNDVKTIIVATLCVVFAKQNPRFDTCIFINACTYQPKADKNHDTRT